MESFLESVYGACMVQDENQWMALHTAVFYRAPEPLLRTIIALNPAACEALNSDQWLPLHLAVRYGTPVGVLREMMMVCDKSAVYPGVSSRKPGWMASLQAGNNGWLPLHIALRYGAEPQSVITLINSFPEACARPNPNGWLPIHRAARYARTPDPRRQPASRRCAASARPTPGQPGAHARMCTHPGGGGELGEEGEAAFRALARVKRTVGGLQRRMHLTSATASLPLTRRGVVAQVPGPEDHGQAAASQAERRIQSAVWPARGLHTPEHDGGGRRDAAHRCGTQVWRGAAPPLRPAHPLPSP